MIRLFYPLQASFLYCPHNMGRFTRPCGPSVLLVGEMSEKLDRMKGQKEKAEQKLRYYQHQEKMLEHRIPELTRKARTHRLCTRGGMLESFLICPGELTDDQVMELLKLSFRQQEVVLALAKMIHDLQEARGDPNPLE